MSLVVCSRFGKDEYLVSFRAIRVAGLMWCIALCTADCRVCACWAFPAYREGAQILFSFGGPYTDGPAGGVSAQSGRVRGSEKHVHSKEGSTKHIYECPCASASL